MSQSEILFERRGAAGVVRLNRPKALNAVTHGMVRALRAELDRWTSDPAITRVVITAAGSEAFYIEIDSAAQQLKRVAPSTTMRGM